MRLRNFILTNFPFLEDDFDALTDYQLFCKMLAYVKSIAKEYDYLDKKLKEFENYFNNLDLQEEVDKKLDELLADGQLTDIISQFIALQINYTFNTVADLKLATNLTNGSFVCTKGYNYLNDNGGADYKIRTKTELDVIDDMLILSLHDDTLVAELIAYNKINVAELGANIEESDNSLSIQCALDNFNIIEIDDTYEVSNTLTLDRPNITIQGNGTLLIDRTNNKDLLSISNVSNITIKDITLTNGEVRYGSDGPQDSAIIRGDSIDYLILDNVKVKEVTDLGVELKACKNITVINSLFKDCYYDMLMLLTETENVLVDNCIFDTCTSTYINTYLIANGSNDYSTTVDFMAKNITIQNSKFLNNPNWEGIDTHGCINWTVRNNYIYNCNTGIYCHYDNRTPVTNVLTGNITIENNIIENPDLDSTIGMGIVVSGYAEHFTNNIKIYNNKIKNYGGKSSTYPITVEYAKNFIIKDNDIELYPVAGISTVWVYNGLITNNIIHNPSVSTAYGMLINVYSWMVKIYNNIIDGEQKTIQRGIAMATGGKGLSILGNNLILNYTGYRYTAGGSNNTVIGEVSNSNANRLGIKGVISVDQNDVPKSYCIDEVVRSVSATVSNITITASAGSKIIELPSGEDVMKYLCIGQEIIIPDAGDNDDLTTTIVDIIGVNKFIIKDAIITSVTNKHPSTTASTWSNI